MSWKHIDVWEMPRDDEEPTDLFKSLTPEELAKVKTPSAEEIEYAVARGQAEAEMCHQAARGIKPQPLTPERIEEVMRENAKHKAELRRSLRGTFSLSPRARTMPLD
jgi:hypothetical protein